jgi:hypothetical protein
MSRAYLIGLLLILIGAPIIIYNGALALRPLVSLYEGAMSHPLDQPADAETKASAAMKANATRAAIGVPFVVVGSIMTRFARRRHRRDLARR